MKETEATNPKASALEQAYEANDIKEFEAELIRIKESAYVYPKFNPQDPLALFQIIDNRERPIKHRIEFIKILITHYPTMLTLKNPEELTAYQLAKIEGYKPLVKWLKQAYLDNDIKMDDPINVNHYPPITLIKLINATFKLKSHSNSLMFYILNEPLNPLNQNREALLQNLYNALDDQNQQTMFSRLEALQTTSRKILDYTSQEKHLTKSTYPQFEANIDDSFCAGLVCVLLGFSAPILAVTLIERADAHWTVFHGSTFESIIELILAISLLLTGILLGINAYNTHQYEDKKITSINDQEIKNHIATLMRDPHYIANNANNANQTVRSLHEKVQATSDNIQHFLNRNVEVVVHRSSRDENEQKEKNCCGIFNSVNGGDNEPLLPTGRPTHQR